MTLLLQMKTQPLEHIGTPMLVCPSQTVCQKRNFRCGAFLSIYDTLIELCQARSLPVFSSKPEGPFCLSCTFVFQNEKN